MSNTQVNGNGPAVQPPVSQSYANEGTTSLGTFMPAMCGALSKAMNALIQAMQYITILSRKLSIDETNMGKDVANKIKDNDYDIGEQQQNQSYVNGGMGLGSAVVGGAGIAAGSGLYKGEIADAETNVNGARNYQKALDETPKANVKVGDGPTDTVKFYKTDASGKLVNKEGVALKDGESPVVEREVTISKDMTSAIKERFAQLKEQTTFKEQNGEPADPDAKRTLTDKDGNEVELSDREVMQFMKGTAEEGELADLKSSLGKRVEQLEGKLQHLEQRRDRGQQKRENIGQTIGKGFESIGSMSTANMRKEEKEFEGQNAAGQSALQSINSSVSTLNSTVESKQQELSKVIDNKNAVNTSGVRG